MDWYFEALKKYTVFEGRARRAEYWYFVLFNTLASLILGFVDGLMGSFNPETGLGIMSGIYSLAVLLPSLAVGVRRLHDTNRSGWWLLILFIPIIGVFILLFFMIKDSDINENRFGPNPKLEEPTPF